MGNIVTPEQGLLPLPPYIAATTPYPWWLTTALVIWALLALLCCWLLLLLYLLRYCCKWWRHRQYAADRKGLRNRLFGSGWRNQYGTKNQHFATAPLPPVPPYAVGTGNAGAVRDVYERETFEDDFYDDRLPYVTAAAAAAASGGDSESFSEEEIRRSHDPRLGTGAVTENVERNIQRNITKNYYINEEENYYIQKEPEIQHDQQVQRLPAPTITTVNMAAERIADNPNWENTNTSENLNSESSKQKASAEIVANDPSLSRQNVRSENPPNIYTHRPATPETPRIESRKLAAEPSMLSDDGSITSEMSGHDSESIYETIRIVAPKKQPLPPLEDENEEDDDYKTAGIDEVEIEIKDLIRLQKPDGRNMNTYDDILSSSTTDNYPRQHLQPRVSSSISSSSTLNNLAPADSQQGNMMSGEEQKEETVTETIQTQQIQTTFRQIGQNLDNSAFFIPLTSSSNTNQEQQDDDQKIMIPVSRSPIHYEEHPALQHF